MQPNLTVHTNRQSILKSEVYFSLVMRSLLFLVFGLIFVGIFTLRGSDRPFQEAEKWWSFQAIFANLVTFINIR